MDPKRHHLVWETRAMLAENPSHRPTIDEVLHRLGLCDAMKQEPEVSIFGNCCRSSFISKKLHSVLLSRVEADLRHTTDLVHQSEKNTVELQRKLDETTQTLHTRDSDLAESQAAQLRQNDTCVEVLGMCTVMRTRLNVTKVSSLPMQLYTIRSSRLMTVETSRRN